MRQKTKERDIALQILTHYWKNYSNRTQSEDRPFISINNFKQESQNRFCVTFVRVSSDGTIQRNR